MLISEEKGPLVITVYWQLGVCNSSLLKCPITSDLKCVQSNRPSDTVPPLMIPTAFCSRTGELQRERKGQITGEKMGLIHRHRITFSNINNILAFILSVLPAFGLWLNKNLHV